MHLPFIPNNHFLVADIRESMALDGRLPELVMIVMVDRIYFRCAVLSKSDRTAVAALGEPGR
jgi:hypothetical protein